MEQQSNNVLREQIVAVMDNNECWTGTGDLKITIVTDKLLELVGKVVKQTIFWIGDEDIEVCRNGSIYLPVNKHYEYTDLEEAKNHFIQHIYKKQ